MLRINYLILVMIVFASMFTLVRADVWVLENDLPGADISIGKTIAKACREDGLTSYSLNPADLNGKVLGKITNESLLILTDCEILPIEAAPALDEYISRGGKLISLGGTLFNEPVTMYSGKWLTEKEDLGRLAEIPEDNILLDYSNTQQSWTRNNGTIDTQVVPEIVQDSQKGSCLHISINSINDYDLFFSPALTDANAEKYDYICFWAKGGSQTQRMSVAFEEIDSSVWVCEIPLTQNWKRYVISVKDFTKRNAACFQDTMPNGEGRILNIAKIKRFACGQIRRPDFSDFSNHEFWISKIGFGDGAQYEPKNWDIRFKHRDMLFPEYHAYSCSDVSKIVVSNGQEHEISGKQFYLPDKIKAFHPRSKSIGFNKSRFYRWIPLLEAVSPTGQQRGTIAALRFDRKFENVWAGFAIKEPAFYLHENTTVFIVDLVKRILNGNFLWEGGSSQFTYFPEQDIHVGASTIVNNLKQELQLKLTVTDLANQKEIMVKSKEGSSLKLDNLLGKADSFHEDSAYCVRVSLVTKEGILVDQLEHNFGIWQPNKNMEWITAKSGDFYLGDELWHPYGVNYMPSSGIAREPDDSHAFEHWFSSEAYDPDVIERDLSCIADLGINTLCVFIYNSDIDSWNFIDFLRRCENHNLRINLSFRDVMPQLNFQAFKVKELIERNRLDVNRTIFAYDLSWEYRFQSGYYDFPDTIEDWNKWLISKYSTLERAVDSWSFQPEIEIINGLAIPPTHEQWYRSGDWNKMLEDFAEFLNTILHNRYSTARDYIRSIDSHHLVSFRMQYSGDPTFVYPPLVPYDLKGVANSVDVMEPEAYGRIGSLEKVRVGIFTNAYARAVAPELPVFWPEVGYSVWEPITRASSLKLHEEGAAYYRDFLQMLIESHANGVAFWWYPGGFRTVENSDYGVINPDGTDRPITQVIREFAPKFKNMGPVPVSEVWVRYPRDWKPGGIVGAYEEIKNEFWQNIDAGKVTGLKIQ